jgi:hypothetical protein
MLHLGQMNLSSTLGLLVEELVWLLLCVCLLLDIPRANIHHRDGVLVLDAIPILFCTLRGVSASCTATHRKIGIVIDQIEVTNEFMKFKACEDRTVLQCALKLLRSTFKFIITVKGIVLKQQYAASEPMIEILNLQMLSVHSTLFCCSFDHTTVITVDHRGKRASSMVVSGGQQMHLTASQLHIGGPLTILVFGALVDSSYRDMIKVEIQSVTVDISSKTISVEVGDLVCTADVLWGDGLSCVVATVSLLISVLFPISGPQDGAQKDKEVKKEVKVRVRSVRADVNIHQRGTGQRMLTLFMASEATRVKCSTLNQVTEIECDTGGLSVCDTDNLALDVCEVREVRLCCTPQAANIQAEAVLIFASPEIISAVEKATISMQGSDMDWVVLGREPGREERSESESESEEKCPESRDSHLPADQTVTITSASILIGNVDCECVIGDHVVRLSVNHVFIEMSAETAGRNFKCAVLDGWLSTRPAVLWDKTWRHIAHFLRLRVELRSSPAGQGSEEDCTLSIELAGQEHGSHSALFFTAREICLFLNLLHACKDLTTQLMDTSSTSSEYPMTNQPFFRVVMISRLSVEVQNEGIPLTVLHFEEVVLANKSSADVALLLYKFYVKSLLQQCPALLRRYLGI